MLLPHIESYNEQNCELIHDSHTSDLIQNELYTSYDNFEFDVNFVDDNPFSDIKDDQSVMFHSEFSEFVKLVDNHYHNSRAKSHSENSHYKQRPSKFHSFNNVLEISDLPDNDLVHDSPTPFANQSISSLHFNQSQSANRNTRTKYDLRLLP